MERLTQILADMLRAALAWEEEHGKSEALTGIHPSYTLLPPEITKAEEKNDNYQKPKETTDV
jgi:hypothetical protein